MTITEQDSMTPAELFAEVEESVLPIFERIGWAEEEIAAAARRYPAATDELWHSFHLLEATYDRMLHEPVYRAHCREILERVASGSDTRPGTSVEVIFAISAASQIAPPGTVVAGLAARLWSQTFPDWEVWGPDQVKHYEGLKGSAIDDLEAEARRRQAVPARHNGEIRCGGQHHGEAVKCRYAASQQLELPAA